MRRGEPLDHEWIRAELLSRRTFAGASLRYVERVGSTSDLARDLARDGASHGTTVLADEQIAARGRRGASRWQTPARLSIAMSTVLRPVGAHATQLGRLGLCIAVAVAEAVEASTGVAVEVKWPNDLVVAPPMMPLSETRKLGGILVEPAVTASVPARVNYVVVGIGLNANLPAASMAPVDVGALSPVALIDLVGEAVLRETLIVEILTAIDGASQGWSNDAWPAWRARYEGRMAWRGVHVVADDHSGTGDHRGGVISGVDTMGALVVLRTDGVIETISVGRIRAMNHRTNPKRA